MLCFPQLQSGAAAQYPITKRLVFPSMETETPGGARMVAGFPERAYIEWKLRFTALSRVEADNLKHFFHSASGRYREFLFLDPLGNLLMWSEELRASCWSLGPGLLIEPLEDTNSIFRGHRVTNVSGAVQSIAQPVLAPAHYCYTLSLSARSDNSSSFSLSLGNSTISITNSYRAPSERKKVWISGAPGGEDESITAYVHIDPGASIDLWELQLEAQPGPSSYKRTSSVSSVYRNARLLEDEIRIAATSPESYATTLHVVAPLE